MFATFDQCFILKMKTRMKSNCTYPHVIRMPSMNNFQQHRSVTTIKVFILLTGSVAEPHADNCCILTQEQFTFLWQHPPGWNIVFDWVSPRIFCTDNGMNNLPLVFNIPAQRGDVGAFPQQRVLPMFVLANFCSTLLHFRDRKDREDLDVMLFTDIV